MEVIMKGKLIPERLKAAREAKGLSLTDAAKAIGIDKAALWRYEHGEMGVSDTAIRILAIYLGTSVDYLTGVTNNPAPVVLLVDVQSYQNISKFISGFLQLSDNFQELIIQMIDQLNGA